MSKNAKAQKVQVLGKHTPKTSSKMVVKKKSQAGTENLNFSQGGWSKSDAAGSPMLHTQGS